jgi:hypothetical protein
MWSTATPEDAMNQIPQWLLMILMSGFGAYLATYLREKGKNLATREDLDPIVRGQETIKQQLAHSMFVEGRRWELKREVSWNLLSHLTKAEVSLVAQSGYFIEPGSEHRDCSNEPGFAELSASSSEALRTIEELAGPAQLFLPQEAIDALRKLAVDEWHAAYSSAGDRKGYIDATIPLVTHARAVVLAAAKAELAPPFKQMAN